MIGTDRYAYASRLRKTEPIPKLCACAACTVVCLCCDSIAVGVCTVVLMSLLSVGLGGTKPRVLLRFFQIPLVFLLLGCLTILVERQPLGAPMLVAVRAGGSLWGLTPGSLWLGGRIFCKAMGVIACMYFLALNTPMTDITLALERLHLPRLFVELMELIYRFIFVLTEAMGRIRTAQESRLGYVGFRRSLESTGTLCSMVFLRAWRKGDKVYSALESRGYNGSLATLPADYLGGKALYAWGAGAAAVQLAVFCMERRLLP